MLVAAFLAVWTSSVLVQRPAPDSAARARVIVVLKEVQDSLDRVRGAAYNFRTDLGGASPVVLYNRALPQLYTGCSAELLAQPVNAVRLMLHPQGLALVL